jgi:methylated-DNA-[protein]-cysteine S-methyltransferase
MKLNGTDFQVQVWKEIKKIPKGETRSYKEIAIAIGSPKASRAVANACGKNPYPIVIPCHRVVKSDGSVGGYSGIGGIKKKKELLDQENRLTT